MAPKPMGSRRVGSKFFLIASQMSKPPMAHMSTICQVMAWKPSIKN